MSSLEIVISPAKFRAVFGDLELCVSETPFFDGARELLKRRLAQPGDMLTLRHAGAVYWSMRATVRRAAGSMLVETRAGPRCRQYTPHPIALARRIAQNEEVATSLPETGNNEPLETGRSGKEAA